MARLGSLCALIGGELHGDPEREIEGVAPLTTAGPNDLSFFTHPKYRAALEGTRAAAVVVAPEHRALAIKGSRALLVVDAPYLAMARIAAHLNPPPPPLRGVSPKAWVHPEAQVAPDAAIGPGAVVEAGAKIGARAEIGPLAYVGPFAQLGDDVRLGPGAKVLARCRLHARVRVGPGAVIGGDGFGYAVDADGRRERIPQLGIVVLEDDVEVGANSTIDRATFGETRIGRGTKIDNLVQVAHNVVTGPDCVIVSQSGVAGSARLGARVIMGAQTGAVGHIEVGDDVMVGARGALGSDTPGPGAYSGAPAYPHKEWLKNRALERELPRFRRELREILDRLQALEDDA